MPFGDVEERPTNSSAGIDIMSFVNVTSTVRPFPPKSQLNASIPSSPFQPAYIAPSRLSDLQECATVRILRRNLQPRRTLCWSIAPDVSAPITAGDTFLVHYTALDQPAIADGSVALVDEKVAIILLETTIIPPFHQPIAPL